MHAMGKAKGKGMSAPKGKGKVGAQWKKLVEWEKTKVRNESNLQGHLHIRTESKAAGMGVSYNLDDWYAKPDVIGGERMISEGENEKEKGKGKKQVAKKNWWKEKDAKKKTWDWNNNEWETTEESQNEK
eukprot:GEMP01123813.1.p1 GENE.GEMP01123813.1~~GEMP01123813.1.p1  ORF type:complete len:129 (+),score=42.18 GEMP01123813.1:2-388(+)